MVEFIPNMLFVWEVKISSRWDSHSVFSSFEVLAIIDLAFVRTKTVVLKTRH